MIDDQERHLHQAARDNRARLAVAHRDVVMEEQAKKAFDIRENMARLRELRVAKEAQEARTEISKANQPAGPKSKSDSDRKPREARDPNLSPSP